MCSSKSHVTRRSALAMGVSGTLLPTVAKAGQPPALTWDDLIPPGTPYSQIIADGEIDPIADRWKPIFDEHGTKLNHAYHGQTVQIPGFIIPTGPANDGVREFLLAPRQSVCSHVQPPPPNQIVLATSREPIEPKLLWAAVRMTGTLTAEPASTNIAEVGYRLTVDHAEMFF